MEYIESGKECCKIPRGSRLGKFDVGFALIENIAIMIISGRVNSNFFIGMREKVRGFFRLQR